MNSRRVVQSGAFITLATAIVLGLASGGAASTLALAGSTEEEQF